MTQNPRGTGLKTLLRQFDGPDGDERARAIFEQLRWPSGPVCPRCDAGNPYILTPRATSKRPGRKGLYKCRAKECRKQFTVTVGTIMEDSHIPLGTWMVAFQMLASNKKGISAHWLHRNLELSYKSAWFMAHRIREAMKRPPLVEKLAGIIEADETYVGGKPRAYEPRTTGRPKRGSKKVPVLSLVQRGGDVRSFPIWDGSVSGNNLKAKIREHVDRDADIFTDELAAYQGLRREFGDHQVVTHSRNEYARGDVHTNTVEGYFSLLKRGITGIYHHVGRKHLHRYLNEFDFRYNGRYVTDGERMVRAIKGAEGRRLMYREPVTRG